MRCSQIVLAVNSFRNVGIDGISPGKQVGLVTVSLGTRGFFFCFPRRAYLFHYQAAHAMCHKNNRCLHDMLISPIQEPLLRTAYISIFLQIWRVVEISEESLAEIVNSQGALSLLCPV